MLILTIRTETPEAELGLYLNDRKLDYFKWQAHRELSETIHTNIDKLLHKNNFSFNDLVGLIVYSGPGSFTGLRIGFSVANALAYSLKLKIVSTNGDTWINDGINQLKTVEIFEPVFPFYGAEVNITKAKK
ncbi:MAG TPA: tRNA (adenosine(37)-N6)-threonylcarbamoyltransferase complex dimerization subunit type 1 TsaB [Candidatus Dormibacteraeota bacterium]|nr:tRNA (adenosine(37)-N6)-threonylcarbamoyltransferase complex dimerization subunit type 1 TsaB [Candidatus Dormibacteraeota bacterium]